MVSRKRPAESIDLTGDDNVYSSSQPFTDSSSQEYASSQLSSSQPIQRPQKQARTQFNNALRDGAVAGSSQAEPLLIDDDDNDEEEDELQEVQDGTQVCEADCATPCEK
jgi:hypothetical protein